MRAAVGDRITVRGNETGQPDRSAIILAVEGSEGTAPYRVRWDDDDHESIFVPGADSLVEHLPVARTADQA